MKKQKRSEQIAKISGSETAYIVLVGKYKLKNYLKVLRVNEIILLKL
jgi:hypothetical protein